MPIRLPPKAARTALFDSVLEIAVRAAAPTYVGLYKGAWAHPGVCGKNDAIYDLPPWELSG